MAGNSNSGRHRLPISEHLESGNYRPSRHGAIPDIATGEPEMPRGLKPAERAWWQRYVPQLVAMGMAKAIDAPALHRMAQLWALLQRAAAVAHKAGVRAAKKGQGDRSTTMNLAALEQQYAELEERFGMTPRARHKLRIQPKESAPKGVASRERA